MQQQEMFKYDSDVLKEEHKRLCEKNLMQIPVEQRDRFKALIPQLSTMIEKLETIVVLNEQAKQNDVFKEKLHQNLREYLSWKNSLFKQHVLNKQYSGPNEPNFSRLFTNTSKKNGVLDYGKGENADDCTNDGEAEILTTDTIQ